MQDRIHTICRVTCIEVQYSMY